LRDTRAAQAAGAARGAADIGGGLKRESKGLERLAADSLHSIAGRGIARRDFVQTLLTQHLPAHPGYRGEMAWILMMPEQRLQKQPRCHAAPRPQDRVRSPRREILRAVPRFAP